MFMDALKMSLPADAVLGFMLYMLGAAWCLPSMRSSIRA